MNDRDRLRAYHNDSSGDDPAHPADQSALRRALRNTDAGAGTDVTEQERISLIKQRYEETVRQERLKRLEKSPYAHGTGGVMRYIKAKFKLVRQASMSPRHHHQNQNHQQGVLHQNSGHAGDKSPENAAWSDNTEIREEIDGELPGAPENGAPFALPEVSPHRNAKNYGQASEHISKSFISQPQTIAANGTDSLSPPKQKSPRANNRLSNSVCSERGLVGVAPQSDQNASRAQNASVLLPNGDYNSHTLARKHLLQQQGAPSRIRMLHYDMPKQQVKSPEKRDAQQRSGDDSDGDAPAKGESKQYYSICTQDTVPGTLLPAITSPPSMVALTGAQNDKIMPQKRARHLVLAPNGKRPAESRDSTTISNTKNTNASNNDNNNNNNNNSIIVNVKNSIIQARSDQRPPPHPRHRQHQRSLIESSLKMITQHEKIVPSGAPVNETSQNLQRLGASASTKKSTKKLHREHSNSFSVCPDNARKESAVQLDAQQQQQKNSGSAPAMNNSGSKPRQGQPGGKEYPGTFAVREQYHRSVSPVVQRAKNSVVAAENNEYKQEEQRAKKLRELMDYSLNKDLTEISDVLRRMKYQSKQLQQLKRYHILGIPLQYAKFGKSVKFAVDDGNS